MATGLAAAVLVATINPMAAQATPRASSCAGCHAGATTATVTAVPSSATVAPGASYTVAITLSANPGGGMTGYGIVPVAPAVEKVFGGGSSAALSYSATMVAPAAAGTYSYTVWTNQGSTDGTGQVGSKVYSITVGAVVTTPPVTTTTPPVTTTTPPVTSTTPPVTSTTPPVTSTTPPVTTTTPPVTTTTPPVTTVPPMPVATISGRVDMSPNGTVGTSHLGMYSSYGTMSCATCHDGVDLPKAPVLAVRDADMRRGVSCSSCHSAGDRDRGRADALFISSMNDRSKIVYSRCSSCHTIASDGDGGGGWGGGGWGGGSGGGYGGGGGGR